MCRVERVDHVLLLDGGELGELGDRRRPAEARRQLVEDARQADAQLLHPPRHVHRPCPVAEVPADLPHDRRHAVARELDPPRDVEPVDRLDQTERTDLHEVLERLAASGVSPGERPHQRHQLDEELLACRPIPVPVVREQELLDRAAVQGRGLVEATLRHLTSGPATAGTSFARFPLRHHLGHLRSPRVSSPGLYPGLPPANVSSGARRGITGRRPTKGGGTCTSAEASSR